MKHDTLVFVYNADSSIFSQASDFAHKILSPETYSCDLCKLTYGNVSMRQEWKRFLEFLPQEKVFLHKDERTGEYESLREYDPPFIARVKNEEEYDILIDAQDMREVKTLTSLIERLKNRSGVWEVFFFVYTEDT